MEISEWKTKTHYEWQPASGGWVSRSVIMDSRGSKVTVHVSRSETTAEARALLNEYVAKNDIFHDPMPRDTAIGDISYATHGIVTLVSGLLFVIVQLATGERVDVLAIARKVLEVAGKKDGQ